MSKCPFCGTATQPWIKCPIDPKTGKSTRFANAALCPTCDIGAIDPMPKAEEISAFYDLETYYTHGKGHFEDAPNTIADRVLTKLAWLFDHGVTLSVEKVVSRFGGKGSVCDLGCGTGDYLIGLASHGWDVTGVEPDAKARAFVRSRGFDAYDGTAELIPDAIKDIRFDLVIMTHVLEHCRSPAVALANAVGLLKPGGRLLLEVPNKDCFHFRTFGGGSECYDAPRHLFFFGKIGLRNLLKTSNMQIEEFYYHGLTRHHLPSWRATEQKIRKFIIAEGGGPPPAHTWAFSFWLLLRELGASPDQRYDAIGLWARKRD
jgi:SAM-dependent methyltransferase